MHGQVTTGKQSLRLELKHINLLVRAGATVLEPSLATPRSSKQEPKDEATGVHDALISSARSVFVARDAPEDSHQNGDSTVAEGIDDVLAEYERFQAENR